MRRSMLRAGFALGALSLTVSCSSDGSTRVLQEYDSFVGSLPVRVTLDDALRVCTSTANSPPDCMSAQPTPSDGIQEARLDALSGAPFILRLLVSPGTEFTDLPADQARIPVAMNTELVMARYDDAPACFHMTDAKGKTHTVSVAASVVDPGTGVTAMASEEPPC